jgi:hypothetical protein
MSARSTSSRVAGHQDVAQIKHAGPKGPKSIFFGENLLLAHPTQLAESFPMGPCSTSGDKNSLSDMTSGLTTVTATSALSRETPTKETPETAEMHILGKRLKRL